MPARSKKRRIAKSHKSIKIPKFIFYLFILLLLLSPPIYLYSSRNFWKNDRKVSVAIRGKEGNVNIVTFDPKLSEISTIYIPENTQVDAARGLGVWKLGSIWELGEQEGVGGELLAQTVTKHFKFPVASWADMLALGLRGERLSDGLKAIALPYETNLTLGDKLGIFLFSLSVKNPNRVEIDLSQTSYLKKQNLVDGTAGFVTSGAPPAGILAIFVDDEISQKALRIKLVDKTGEPGLAEEVGEILESLGGKIAVIEKAGVQEGQCTIRAKESEIGERLIRFLPCGFSDKGVGAFDIEIEIGEEFSKIY